MDKRVEREKKIFGDRLNSDYDIICIIKKILTKQI